MATIGITSSWIPLSVLALTVSLDVDRMVNAVNSALGEMSKDEESGGAKAVLSWKSKKNEGESFRLRESIVNYYTHKGGNNALRFFYFCQEVKSIEKVTGKLVLSDWPEYLVGWTKKFAKGEEKKAA